MIYVTFEKCAFVNVTKYLPECTDVVSTIELCLVTGRVLDITDGINIDGLLFLPFNIVVRLLIFIV